MHRDTLLKLLGPLASLRCKNKLIVNGTKEDYYLPDQLLEDGYYFLKRPAIGDLIKQESVVAFSRILNEHAPRIPLDDLNISLDQIINKNSSWNKIRSAALLVLKENGVDLEEWEHIQCKAR